LSVLCNKEYDDDDDDQIILPFPNSDQTDAQQLVMAGIWLAYKIYKLSSWVTVNTGQKDAG